MAIGSSYGIPDDLDFSIAGFDWSLSPDWTGLAADNPNVLQIPGFSDVPLVVDVVDSPVEVPYVRQEPSKGQPMDYLDFTPIGGPIDFPGAPTSGGNFPSIPGLIQQGLSTIQGLVEQNPQLPSSYPPIIPNVGTLSVNATACPTVYTPAGKLVHQHLRKQQVKPRKSPVTQCVTNRHMNSLNPHALRRATRRLKGFMGHVHSAQKAIRQALGHTISSPGRKRTASRGGCFTCGRSARACVC